MAANTPATRAAQRIHVNATKAKQVRMTGQKDFSPGHHGAGTKRKKRKRK